MSKGFCTSLKVLGIVCGSIIAITGIYFLVTMLSSMSAMSSYSYGSGYNSAMSSMVVLYVLLSLFVIIQGFVTFAVLFFAGAAGDYMRLKLQKDGIWGASNLMPIQNPYYGYQPQAQVQPPPDAAAGDGQNTVS